MSRWVRVTAGLLAVALAVLLVVSFYLHSTRTQWDFATYYLAAQAESAGMDPYDLNSLTTLAGGPWIFPFVYPPSGLWVMKPLTHLSPAAAERVFLLLKCLATVGLVWLLGRAFLRDATDGRFWLFCLLAFQSALWMDLQAGNVAVFEQLALWTGFYCFLRGRMLLFCIFVLLASVFKLVPVMFLGLLLFSRDRRRWLWLGGSAAAFAAFLAAQYAWRPDLFTGFMRSAGALQERALKFNPSLLAFVQDLPSAFARPNAVYPPGLDWAIYGVLAALILCVTLWCWRRVNAEGEERALLLISLACVVSALVLPRFKTYTYIQLLLPAYLLMRRVGRESPVAFGLLFFLAVLSDTYPCKWPAMKPDVFPYSLVYHFWRYYPLLLAALVWGLYLRLILRGAPVRVLEPKGVPAK